MPSVLFNCITVSVLTLISREKVNSLTLLLLTAFIYSIIPDEIVDGKYNCMYLCFIVGYMLNMSNANILPIRKSFWAFPFVAFAMVISAIFYDDSMYIYPKDFTILNYDTTSIVSVLCNLLQRCTVRVVGSLGFISLIAWYDLIPKRLRQVIRNLSSYSLGVYCATTIMLSIYYKIMGNLGINLSHNYVYPVILAIILTTISYCFFCIYDKKRILNTLFLGGR